MAVLAFGLVEPECRLSDTSRSGCRVGRRMSAGPATGPGLAPCPQVRTVTIPTGVEASSERLAPLLSTLPPELRGGMERFIAAAFAVRPRGRPGWRPGQRLACPTSGAGSRERRIAACEGSAPRPVTLASHYLPPRQVYLDLDFTLLEMNPFTLDAAGQPFPLDMRGELDDTAAFRRWGPPPSAHLPCTCMQAWPAASPCLLRACGVWAEFEGVACACLCSSRAWLLTGWAGWLGQGGWVHYGATLCRCACRPRLRSAKKWGDVEFPLPFGRTMTPQVC